MGRGVYGLRHRFLWGLNGGLGVVAWHMLILHKIG